VPTATWSGNPQSFIFSLTFNLKLPFHGRNVVSLTNNEDMIANSMLQEPMAFFGTNEQLMIGNGDLVLDTKLMHASSEVEMSYGIGLPSNQALVQKALLGGSTHFQISDVEVWTVNY
jgi:hypothetical protein